MKIGIEGEIITGIMLTAGPDAPTVVSLEVDGRWIEVIRDTGVIISRVVGGVGILGAVVESRRGPQEMM